MELALLKEREMRKSLEHEVVTMRTLARTAALVLNHDPNPEPNLNPTLTRSWPCVASAARHRRWSRRRSMRACTRTGVRPPHPDATHPDATHPARPSACDPTHRTCDPTRPARDLTRPYATSGGTEALEEKVKECGRMILRWVRK